ncbi:MAG: hypothetical protein IJM92_00630 [Fibrobacter sp.]|uniref:hypothetical protein n=1 Tax=Fibrobacter sp. TaxID=35828 RepID=UPI0025BAD6E2|nr:hypothetical protein [Fibrobacter sp.]MBQ3715753.1 hypothetical protein [Fibrobacter sp.]MBQ7078179.1 hypothetical protein [Fibrobacter sp.]
MSCLQKIGLVAFAAFVAFAVMFSYLTKSQFIRMPEKPWHMQPAIDADSLTEGYVSKYELLDRRKLIGQFADSSRVTVSILVDAWGVPFGESLLAEDFAIFKDVPHREFLHHRLANRTRHAEFAELRIPGDSTRPHGGVYLFGGDSLEYGRNLYIDSLGYGVRLFCQKCPDSVMAATLDSVLAAVAVDSASPVKNVAWTTQGSRDGDRAKLHATLRLIAGVARRHPEARFIVQGTHRPILGDPKIRRESFAHWVPVVIF